MQDADLIRNAANHVPLNPVSFLARAAEVYGERLAVVHGDLRRSWREVHARSRQLADGLRKLGVAPGDTVAVLLPNVPAMVEAHFGIPMCGAVLNTLNTRLDAASIRLMLEHGEARAVLVDREFSPLLDAALEGCAVQPQVIDVPDALFDGTASTHAQLDYEALLASGDPAASIHMPADEWDSICLNYTSGTTGNPKGVVYHYRGAYLNAVSNILEWDLPKHPVYLWTLPMFHCNGWCFPWTLAARTGVNVCLRRFDAQRALDLIEQHGVTHYCGAPIVHAALAGAAAARGPLPHTVRAMIAGAAPPAALLAEMTRLGFELRHVYGLTEVYGPAAVCDPQQSWQTLDAAEQTKKLSRQGVRYHLEEAVTVIDRNTGEIVPADGETLGEVVFRGNICMKGYLKNPEATARAFAGGWFHSGDLGVLHADGYIKLKDRDKDIIISGGENISSIEIEDALHQHPAVFAAAVVARPDAKWGETPHAFVELKPGAQTTAEELLDHCKLHLAGFKRPRFLDIVTLPKTATGKIQKYELRAGLKSASAIDG